MKNYIQSTYIKTARSELGLTQSAMAEKLGVTRHTVESWEQGRRTPTETALKLLEFILAAEEKTSKTS